MIKKGEICFYFFLLLFRQLQIFFFFLVTLLICIIIFCVIFILFKIKKYKLTNQPKLQGICGLSVPLTCMNFCWSPRSYKCHHMQLQGNCLSISVTHVLSLYGSLPLIGSSSVSYLSLDVTSRLSLYFFFTFPWKMRSC